MRKLTVLLLLLVAGTLSYAQTNQQLLEAYRNGTLSETQIGELRKEAAVANQENVLRDRGINAGTVAPGQTQGTAADEDGVAVHILVNIGTHNAVVVTGGNGLVISGATGGTLPVDQQDILLSFTGKLHQLQMPVRFG